MIGEKFGELIVLDVDIEKTNSNPRHGPWMKCRCSCGKEKSILFHHLKNGHTVSCGCYNRNKSKIDLTGQKFGRLLVKCETNKRSPDGSIIWECLCECGNTVLISSKNLLRGHVSSCGCLKSKNEEKISKLLKLNKVHFKTQFSFSDLKNPQTDGNLKFDFAIFDDNNCIVMFIEYDGIHHFEVCNFSGNIKEMIIRFRNQQKCDKIKNDYCKNNGFSLLRISYKYEDEVEKLVINALKEKGVI